MTAWPPQTLVLTAGLGTRLRPLTDYRAKPAMPVGLESLASRILRGLADAGIRDAVLNLHHLPHTITREVGDGSQCGVRVRYSWEQPLLLGSAGGPRHALPLLDGETLLIVNGDTLCDIPLRPLWDAHTASGALVTMGLMPHPQPGRYGGVVVGADPPDSRLPGPESRILAEGPVVAFVPRTSPLPSVHFPGVQLVRRQVLADLPDNTLLESVLGVYPQLMARLPGAVQGVVFDAHFEDVGTVDDYRRTCRTLAGDGDGNVIAPGARVAASASLHNCVVWPDADIPDDCMLEDVVVTGHVPIAAASRLRSTTA